MKTRIHMVLDLATKARLEAAARGAGISLSAWLRDAAEEKMMAGASGPLASADELRAFFEACDQREAGHEPDWEAHRRVIEKSATSGIAES